MGLRDWFGGKSASDEKWRKHAARATVRALDEDTGELVKIKPSDDKPDDVEGLLIGFQYMDGGGSRSSRAVLCHQAFRTSDGCYIRGLCTIRDALRTFRVDRMTNVVELRSNRAIPDHVSFFRRVARYDEDVFDKRREKAAEFQAFLDDDDDAERLDFERQARKSTLDGLRILAYISLSDGSSSEDEMDAAQDYVSERMISVGLTDDEDHFEDAIDAVMFMARGLTPTQRSFVTAIGKIAADDDHLAMVARHAMALVRKDATISAEEREALNLLLATARKKRK